jgi:hypothetical protein
LTDYFLRLSNIDLDGDNSVEKIEYHFNLIQSFDERNEIPFSVIEADEPVRSAALGFSGKKRKISISWIIHDNGQDKARGTVPTGLDSRLSNDTVKTVEEQILYLRKYFHNPTLGAQWRLFGGDYSDPDNDGTDEGTPVAISRVPLSRRSSSSQKAEASVEMEVSQVV